MRNLVVPTISKEKRVTGVWKLPPPIFLKFNVDSASKGKPGPVGIGSVLRDDKGLVKMILSKSIRVANFNLAELLALRKVVFMFVASKWVNSHGLWLESDSKNAVKWFLSPVSASWRMKKFTAQIEALKSDLIRWDISYVPREINEMADGFAKSEVEREADLLFKFE
ncbi:hypothetical protein REPUB_Repub06bG0022400 [Reevesia pubescens]